MLTIKSAYRQYHSSETVVVAKVYNDLLIAADGRQVSTLCLVDLSAALDHELLMLRLERQFGLGGVALQWFSSYLSGRTFQVVHGGNTSSVIYHVPYHKDQFSARVC